MPMPLIPAIIALRNMCSAKSTLPWLLVSLIAGGSWLSHVPVSAAKNLADSNIRSRDDLDHGAILFEYYQQNYFEGLIEHEYAATKGNAKALNDRGQLLEGGMALSFGMADRAQNSFNQLLAAETDVEVRNRAWFYLGKLYHASSRPEDAYEALQHIEGKVPNDLHLDYHYLTTLVNNNPDNLAKVQTATASMSRDAPQYLYLLFNLGVSYLARGDQPMGVSNLATVIESADGSEELLVLADRARHGLAQLALQDQQMGKAWRHLQDIRSEGLYSSRALLAYAWTAIHQELYPVALPALQLLNQRSIALPEVQECKVLLGHLYEQQGSTSRALKSHLQAESDFLKGLEQLEEARRIVDNREVPRDFIANLEVIVDDSDWFASRPAMDYSKLSPFLVDLMASNTFTQVLDELVALYSIDNNLAYWEEQTRQHQVILDNAAGKIFNDQTKALLGDSQRLHARLNNERQDLGLLTLVLKPEEQARFVALLEYNSKELARLNDKLEFLQRKGAPYRQPPAYPSMVTQHHQRISDRREETETYIAALEPLMRKMVKAELNKHEERMRYYLAQTRLAKARLYDTALMELEEPSGHPTPTGDTP